MTRFASAGIFILLLGLVSAEYCAEGEPVVQYDVHDEQRPSVFDDLTTTEIEAVYDYLKEKPEFNIKEADMVTLDSTYVYHMELMTPPKKQVLEFLDKSGSKPERYAWVVMFRGDQTPAVIEEYKVGPLPSVTTHNKLSIAGHTDVEYKRRPLFTPADLTAWNLVTARETTKIDHILRQVTGGYTYNNCTDKCLTWFPGMPGQFKSGDRSMWIYLTRKLEGYYLHPIGLQFRVEASDRLDVGSWRVLYVWFRGQSFDSFDEIASSTNLENTPSEGAPTLQDPPNLYSSLYQRGDPLPTKKQRGPQTFMPDGRRYSVDRHHVEWQGWSFDLNMRSLIGLQVHDARFKDTRVAYELSISEIGIIYSGTSPSPMKTAYVDSPFTFGMESFELVPGADCPEHATYFDFAHYYNFKPVIYKNSVCLFEHDRGMPMRHHRHPEWNGGFHVHSMPGNVLIMRTIMTVYNYEYILDYIFHQNGVLEVSVTLSGYVLTNFYTANDPAGNSRGYQIVPEGLGGIHNHILQFKVDLDVGKTENRFSTLNMKVESIPDPTNNAEEILIQSFDEELKEHEKEAVYKYNFDTPKFLIFSNDEDNKYGNKKSYRLLPVQMNKLLLPETWAAAKGLAWERYQVVVTKQKDEEKRGSSEYNLVDLQDPVLSFLDFIEDNETIVDEDLVAWVTLGTFHIPKTEDIPIVQTPSHTLTYYLLPFNYFEEDPSMASRDNVRLTEDADGTRTTEYSGPASESSCQPRSHRSPNSAANFLSSSVVFLVMQVTLLLSL